MELIAVAGFLAVLVSTTSAYDFYVGGRDGWVESPSESYSQWASRMRFQVHDNLVFKYKKSEDSVLVVNKDDYDSCNTSSPMGRMDDGESTFRFEHSGPFYFISGADGKCAKGQKLIVVVLAERTKKTAPPPPSTEPPASPPPPSVSPSASPTAPSPLYPPTISPAQSPSPSSSSSDSADVSPTPSPVQSSSFAPTVWSVSMGVLVMPFAVVMI